MHNVTIDLRLFIIKCTIGNKLMHLKMHKTYAKRKSIWHRRRNDKYQWLLRKNSLNLKMKTDTFCLPLFEWKSK